MNKQKHIIHRQVLEISFSNRDKAFRMQDEISRLYKQELLPLINDMFDEAVSANEHIRIDSLEIDVGRVSLQHFEDALLEKIKKQLKDKLLRSVQKASPKRYPQKDLPGTGPGLSDEATVLSKQFSELERFTFFVKTGQLPWWAAEDQNQPIEKLALKIVRNQPEALAELLIELTSDETYQSRIIYQFSDKVLREFLELNHPGIGEHVSNLINDFYAVHRQEQIIPLSSPNFRLFLWKSAFDFWLSGSTGIRQKMKQYDLPDLNPNIPDPDEITADSRQSYGLSVPDQINDFLIFVLKNVASKRQVERTLPDKQEVRQIIRSIFQSISDRGINTSILKNMLDSVQDELNKLVLDRDKPLPDFEEVRRTSSKVDAENIQEQRPEKKPLDFEESFEIHNAGLVIIAQFLPRFFDNLGLVSEKSFVTDDAAKRAALLLQFIITGETETPEHELILNKILCGLPVDEPLPKSIKISDIEKEEVETLLQSVVEHWEALKGTSAEGLRQTFLIKDGILKQEENGWKLIVERTTVDVLIDKLPWGISVIKLPWHDTMIHVEW